MSNGKSLELTEEQLKALRKFLEESKESGEMGRHLRTIYRKLTILWLGDLPPGTRNVVVDEVMRKTFSEGEEEA